MTSFKKLKSRNQLIAGFSSIFAQLLTDMISVASMFQMRVMRLREVRSFTYG